MRFRAVPVLILSLCGMHVRAQEQVLEWMPLPGRYSAALVRPALPAGASVEYRFTEKGDGIWRPLEGSLDLTASPREERTYTIQIRGSEGGKRFEGEARYVIDRLPPPAPSISPPQGSYEGPLELRLASEPGAGIYYSLEALDRPSPGFRLYDPARPPAMDRPRDGTRAWTVTAYAVDAAGNPGPVSTGRYVLEPAPKGPRAEDAGTASAPGTQAGSDLEYRVDRKYPGSAAVRFAVPDGGRVFAAVNPPDSGDPKYYSELFASGREASLEVTAPVGWTGPILVRYALWKDGALALAPGAVEIKFSFEDPGQAPPAPPGPSVLYPPGTRTVLLSWEPSPFRIEVSVDSGPFKPYSLPLSVSVPEGSRGVVLRYRAVGPGGAFSEVRSLFLEAPKQPTLPEISGLPEHGRTNREVRPRAAPGTVVRYEVSTEGLPPSVHPDSPLLAEGVSFAGEPGRDVRYYLRLRAYTDASREASGSDERFAEFIVDRTPPEPPRLSAGSLSGDSEEDRIVAFEPGEGSIRYAVVEQGVPAESSYRVYTGPVTLEGSADRPRAYHVYAYAVDDAGNRSETLGPVSVRIDRASVYVAPWGNDETGGGPRNPLATVSAGVAAASRSGRRFVRVQGDVRLGTPIRVESEIEILGGCDGSWEPVSGGSSVLSAEGETGPLFVVQGGSLSLRNLAIPVERPGDFFMAEAFDGALSISNLKVRLRGAGELVVLRSRNSSIEILDTEMELAGALFARAVEAEGGSTRIRGLRVRAEDALGYLTAFSFVGGSAELSRIRFESRTSGGFTLVRGRGMRLGIRDSYIKARGSGFLEAFRLEECGSALYAVSADLQSGGPLTFASVEGGRIDILHSTVALRSAGASLLGLRSGSFRLGNSILQDDSGTGTLLKLNEVVPRGAVVRNALSGFRTYLDGPVPAATLDALNRIAAPPDGLNFQETFRESRSPGSLGLPLLPSNSVGLGGAYPVGIPPESPGSPEPSRRNVGALEGSP